MAKSFKSYLGEDAVYNFIIVWLKNVNTVAMWWKNILMTRKDNEDFKNSAKFWICDDDYVYGDVKIKRNYISLDNIGTLYTEIVISTLN